MEDGGFAKHRSFCSVALNTPIHQQARSGSEFYASKHHRTPLAEEDFQRALANPEQPEAQIISNRISLLPM